MANQHIVGPLNHAGKGTESTRHGLIMAKDAIRADSIVGGWHMQGLLHGGLVEIVVGPTRVRGESHFVPQERTKVRQMVHVETRVDVSCGSDNLVPHVASLLT